MAGEREFKRGEAHFGRAGYQLGRNFEIKFTLAVPSQVVQPLKK